MSSDEVLERLRKRIEDQGAEWTAAQTSVSRLAPPARLSRLGLRLSNVAISKGRLQFRAESARSRPPYPETFNWRLHQGQNWVTSVQDQGDCGSCVAFACIAVLESHLVIATGGFHPLSEAHLFFCGGGDCAEGWDIEPALNFMQSQGVTDEQCLPYQFSKGTNPCLRRCNDWRSRLYRITGYQQIGTFDFMKYWISNSGPVLAAMDVFDDFRFYSAGIYSHVSGENIGQHAVAIVGYNDQSEYWICKNSWGTAWGEEGYFAIRYGECNICVEYPVWRMFGPMAPVRKGIYPGRGRFAPSR